MKKIFMLSAAAFLVSSSFVIAGELKPGIKMFDTNQDGYISLLEASEKANQVFEKIDTNNDGLVTKSEFGDHQKTERDSKKPSFDKIDKNGDGKLTKDEVEGRLSKHFEKIDLDSDGAITPQEFIKFQEMKQQDKSVRKEGKRQEGDKPDDHRGERDRQGGDKQDHQRGEKGDRQGGDKQDHQGDHKGFKRIDINGDDVISKDEVKAALTASFAKFDTDNNGQISKEELESFSPKE